MNARKHLILANGQNKTRDIQYCKYNPNTKKYHVTFQGSKTYSYNYDSIEWVKDPEPLNPVFVHISHGERELFSIQNIFVFHARKEDYWHICFGDGSERTYAKRDLHITMSSIHEKEAKKCLDYLRQLAAINELKSDDGEILLQKQYEKLEFVDQSSAMAIFLNPDAHKSRIYPKCTPIFPFGGNASQFKAVEAALENQISVIQGPPGTGKTQTILNLLANLIADNKSVLVVSNNNSAIGNVLEKLASPKCAMDFLVAPLGNSANKKAFVANQTGRYPYLLTWAKDIQQQKELQDKTQHLSAELLAHFSKQERLAKVRVELASLLTEVHYFEEYCKETGRSQLTIKPRRKLKTDRLMQLWQECRAFSDKERSVSFWFKIKSVLFYGISEWRFYKSDMPNIISLMQALFYQARKEELSGEIATLETYLSNAHAHKKMGELTEHSMEYLRAKLFERYGNHVERKTFSEDDLWRRLYFFPTKMQTHIST